LTHAGHHQTRRWLSPIGVEPKYETAEISELAHFTAFMALSAGIEMALLSSNGGGVERLSAMLPKEGA
jgi:hypothetical protein